MWPQAIYEELSGQQLTSVLKQASWDEVTPLSNPRFSWPLFGALALIFERHTLLVYSPLRYMRCQEGTRYGLADGSSVTLGFRALLCDSAQAEDLMSWRQGLPPIDVSQRWVSTALPVIGRTLQAAPRLRLPPQDQPATVLFDFGYGLLYRLEYRRNMDGAIEFDQVRIRSVPPAFEVSQPKGPFGWLHAHNIGGFVLDDRHWRNMEHWPIEVRRQYRDADHQSVSVLKLLKRAWLAYFRQYPDMRRRLLALSVPVRVQGLPEGFVEAVRDELLAEAASNNLALIGQGAGSCAMAMTVRVRPQ